MARAIFDNGGGVTLQLEDWSHWYNNPAQAAKDYKQYIMDGNTDGWDGRDGEAAQVDPTIDEIRNGGYRVMDTDDIKSAVDNPEFEAWDDCMERFIDAMR